MGNKSSQPVATNTPSPTPAPAPLPLPPVCDSACQRQKKLDGLKTALESKSLTKDTDPMGYQQARIAYFTELEGQDWLENEKDRIRKDEIEPVMARYRSQYDGLKEDTKSQGVFVNLMNALKNDEQSNTEEIRYLNKRFQAENDKAQVLNRLNELSPQQTQVVQKKSNLPTIIDVILAIIGIFIVYRIYKRFFSYTATVGGKRVLYKTIR
jgi:hypothetical protein